VARVIIEASGKPEVLLFKGATIMTREEALKLVQEKVQEPELARHMQAVAAIMEGLAERLAEDTERWYLAGLLHDIDYEETKDDPDRHSILGAEMLAGLGLDQEIVYAVKAHGLHEGTIPRISKMDKALCAADGLSGLVTAAAYVMPSHTLAEVQVKTIKKKFKDKAFARGANRDEMRMCEEFGLPLEEFFGVALEAMQRHAGELGLA
jgi:putative nucleotidyltransferase with HDIG domain